MCMISYYPPGIMPVRKHLENGNKLNTDGYGWMLVRGDERLHNISLDGEKAVDQFLRRRAAHPDWHAAFHARHATGTPATLSNCQPMQVGDDKNTLMMHNGLLFHTEGESDSVVFARDILPLYDLNRVSQWSKLQERMGPNKAVIFSADPGQRQVTILNSELGIWQDGAWYSNADYTGIPHITEDACALCGGPNEFPCPGGGWLCAPCDTAAAGRRAVLERF
jgi:hypothetical protein